MSPSAPAVDIAGCGDPVVLLHGLATTRAIWSAWCRGSRERDVS